MNFFSSFQGVLVGFFSFILMLASGLSAAAQQPTLGVVAELWPLERLATDSPRRAFEILRSQAPKSKATTLPLDKFEIPARETPSLVRVRGVLTAPE
ncbi:MAG: hypothetical protein NTZ94_13510, partial [Verrucomicrobia bacterium]|nr:hypothetical protein [Verrucomicrobiota bacterium]